MTDHADHTPAEVLVLREGIRIRAPVAIHSYQMTARALAKSPLWVIEAVAARRYQERLAAAARRHRARNE